MTTTSDQPLPYTAQNAQQHTTAFHTQVDTCNIGRGQHIPGAQSRRWPHHPPCRRPAPRKTRMPNSSCNAGTWCVDKGVGPAPAGHSRAAASEKHRAMVSPYRGDRTFFVFTWALQGCCIWKTQAHRVTLQRGQTIFFYQKHSTAEQTMGHTGKNFCCQEHQGKIMQEMAQKRCYMYTDHNNTENFLSSIANINNTHWHCVFPVNTLQQKPGCLLEKGSLSRAPRENHAKTDNNRVLHGPYQQKYIMPVLKSSKWRQ